MLRFADPRLDTGERVPNIRVTITHINCEQVTDTGILGSDEDELLCRVSSGVGINYRHVRDVGLGDWPRGRNDYITAVLHDGDTGVHGYLRFTIIDSDASEPHYGSDDYIGGVILRWDGASNLSWEPEANTQGFGETNPGSQDFQMTGSGAKYSVWFRAEMLAGLRPTPVNPPTP
jgi:hypothetical protein